MVNWTSALVYLLRKLATILVVEWPAGTWTESWVQWKARKPLGQSRGDQCYRGSNRGSNRFNLLTDIFIMSLMGSIMHALIEGAHWWGKHLNLLEEGTDIKMGFLILVKWKKASEATPWPPEQMQAAGVIISLYQKARSQASHRDPNRDRRLKSCG